MELTSTEIASSEKHRRIEGLLADAVDDCARARVLNAVAREQEHDPSFMLQIALGARPCRPVW